MTRDSAPAVAKALLPLLAAVALGACTGPAPLPAAVSTPPVTAPAAPAAGPPQYRCDQGIVFSVQFGDGAAVVDAGSRGREQLLRDAGGLTPQQTVYSNQQLRAEFGLGPAGNEAMLHYAAPPQRVHCTRQ